MVGLFVSQPSRKQNLRSTRLQPPIHVQDLTVNNLRRQPHLIGFVPPYDGRLTAGEASFNSTYSRDSRAFRTYQKNRTAFSYCISGVVLGLRSA